MMTFAACLSLSASLLSFFTCDMNKYDLAPSKHLEGTEITSIITVYMMISFLCIFVFKCFDKLKMVESFSGFILLVDFVLNCTHSEKLYYINIFNLSITHCKLVDWLYFHGMLGMPRMGKPCHMEDTGAGFALVCLHYNAFNLRTVVLRLNK